MDLFAHEKTSRVRLNAIMAVMDELYPRNRREFLRDVLHPPSVEFLKNCLVGLRQSPPTPVDAASRLRFV